MNRVSVDQILPIEKYEAVRPAMQQRVWFEKARRRVHVGEHLTFLFENAETVRYQVQEMLRIERRSAPEDVAHEVATYNELIGGPGELGCTLLIEIDDPALRATKLAEWLELPAHLYAKLADGRLVRPVFDPRQVGETRVSSVHYLTFPVGDVAPVAIGADHPTLTAETAFAVDQHAALQSDLDAARA
ncbi:MAG: DUF3501 family protein [Planctomycetota bacterium]